MRSRPGRPAPAARDRRPITSVLVVVPARDEQDLLADCLTGLRRAAAAVRVPVLVVLVLDRCTDRSAAIAEAVSAAWGSGATDAGAEVPGHAGHVAGLPADAAAGPGRPVTPIRLEILRSDAGRAGAARAIGVRHGLRTLGGAPGRVWLASTDADSRVPADWLTGHLALAGSGYDLVLGTVALTGGDPALARRWSAGYTTSEGHPHVHAANLGLRAETYLAAGGFAPVASHEDAALAARVTALGARVVRSAATPVTTSARLDGRAPSGVSADLRALALTAPVPPACPQAGSGGIPATAAAQVEGTGASASSISSRLIPSR